MIKFIIFTVFIASCALGGASSCLKQTIDYLKNKMKAGTMNNDSQLKIAEIASKLMACKLILRQAARSMDNKEKKSFMYSARTKWFVPSQAFEVRMQLINYINNIKIFFF